MHLPAQDSSMLRGAEKESGPPGKLRTRIHTHRHTQEDTHGRETRRHGTARGWRPESSRGRKQGQRQTEGPTQRKRSKVSSRGRELGGGGLGGEGVLAGLPVPPKSWGYLLLQPTVAQQKQREQQNYTHHPAQPRPLPTAVAHRPRTVHLLALPQTNAQAVCVRV